MLRRSVLLLMSSVVDDVIFSDPSGRPATLVHFAGALVLSSLHVYAWSVGDIEVSDWWLVMAAGYAAAGTAESLSTSRRRTAGMLRLVAILLLLGLVATVVVAPDFVLG